MFAERLGTTMEVYIDDMLVKSQVASDHINHLKDFFFILNEFGMKLNPTKCTYGVTSREFLGYIVTQRGIEVNPKQIFSIHDLPSHKNSHEVQRLTGRITALNRFISQSTDRSFRGTQALSHNATGVSETRKKRHAIIIHRNLPFAVSSVLIKEDRGEHEPIFYTSKGMMDAKTQYSKLEKMALAVITSALKLKPYFQSHSIVILTNHPLRTQKTRHHIAKRDNELEQDLQLLNDNWIMHVDGFSSLKGSGDFDLQRRSRLHAYCDSQLVVNQFSGIYDPKNEIPRGENICTDALAELGSSPNDQYLEEGYLPEDKWEALAVITSARKLRPYFQSHSIVILTNQLLRTITQNTNQSGRLSKWAIELSEHDITYQSRIPRGENICADALAALGSSQNGHAKRIIPIKRIDQPSITITRGDAAPIASINLINLMQIDVPADQTNNSPSDWYRLFIKYLPEGFLPEDKWKARRLKARSSSYVVINGKLHQWTANKVLLTCVSSEKAELVMAETHKGGRGPRQRWFIIIMTDYFTKKGGRGSIRPRDRSISNGQAEATNKRIIDGIKKRLDLKNGHWAERVGRSTLVTSNDSPPSDQPNSLRG
ncbi:hypothetical protein N665_0010s0011 [Sinapis alba]|nr:hypothetical protein N665_0010s0011 [Sinapis alba]